MPFSTHVGPFLLFSSIVRFIRKAIQYDLKLLIEAPRSKFGFVLMNSARVLLSYDICIKEVMKNHGLQVAKLSRFKSGPNISV